MAVLAIAKALLKSGKFWVIAGAVTAVLAFARWGYNQVYDAGYTAAELKWTQQQQSAIDAAVERAKEQWVAASEVAEENIRVETEIVERVRIVEREVPRIVERVVRPECRDLGADVQRVFNDAIVAASGVSMPDPSEPSE